MDPIKIPQLNTKLDGTPITHADLPAAPGIANPAHVNHLANFFKNVGHVLKDVFVWAPRVADKTITVIEEAEKLTPEFLSGLKAVIKDVAIIVANGAAAAAQKGVNVETDYNVLKGIEALAGDFNKFYPILVRDFNEFEGIITAPVAISNPPTPVTVTPVSPAAPAAVITPAMLGALATSETSNTASPSKITFGK